MQCPLCSAPIAVPPLDDLILALINEHGLSEDAEAVLRAVWGGQGKPVDAEAIFDVMFADDPEGGPSAALSYAALKDAVAELHRAAPGVVVWLGKGKGWRLHLAVMADAA